MSGPGYQNGMDKLLSRTLWGMVHRLTKPSRCGTLGQCKELACLGRCHTPSPGVTTVKKKGSVGPVQGRRECGTVMRQTMRKLVHLYGDTLKSS